MVRNILGAALLFATVACQQARTPVLADGGYLLPGPHAAQAFGVSAVDRLPEVLPEAVPNRVVDAATDAALERGKRPQCNRYFPADNRFIVVFSAFCGSDFGKETDSRLLMAFHVDGRALGEISWMPSTGTAELHPYMRFRGG